MIFVSWRSLRTVVLSKRPDIIEQFQQVRLEKIVSKLIYSSL